MQKLAIVVFASVIMAVTLLVGSTSYAASKDEVLNVTAGRVDQHDRELIAVKWAVKNAKDEVKKLDKSLLPEGKADAHPLAVEVGNLNYEIFRLQALQSKLERKARLADADRARLDKVVYQYGEAIAALQKEQEEQAKRNEKVDFLLRNIVDNADVTRGRVKDVEKGLDVVGGKIDRVAGAQREQGKELAKKQDRLYHELVASFFVDSKDFGPAVGYNLVVPASNGWAVGLGASFGYAGQAGGPAYLLRLFGQKELAEWFALRFGAEGALETKASGGQVRGSNVNLTLGPVFDSGHFVAGLDAGAGVERSADGDYVPISGTALRQRQTQNSFNFIADFYIGVRF